MCEQSNVSEVRIASLAQAAAKMERVCLLLLLFGAQLAHAGVHAPGKMPPGFCTAPRVLPAMRPRTFSLPPLRVFAVGTVKDDRQRTQRSPLEQLEFIYEENLHRRLAEERRSPSPRGREWRRRADSERAVTALARLPAHAHHARRQVALIPPRTAVAEGRKPPRPGLRRRRVAPQQLQQRTRPLRNRAPGARSTTVSSPLSRSARIWPPRPS